MNPRPMPSLPAQHGKAQEIGRALAPSATLRPPKRHHDHWHEGLTQSHSPKRPRPSPDPISPSPTSGSESGLDACLISPLPGSSPVFTSSVGGDLNSELASARITPAVQDEPLLPMDWAPNSPKTAASEDDADDERDPRICYGALCDGRARFNTPAESGRVVSDGGKFCVLNIVRSGPHYVLSTRSNKNVAELDLATCRALSRLEQLGDVISIGIIESAAMPKSSKRPKAKGIVPLSVNIYGPFSRADQVGDALSALSTFLQHPFFLEPACKGYFNPQLFRVNNEIQNLTHLVGLTEQDLRAKTISDEVENILATLDVTSSDDLEVEVSFNPNILLTGLRDHQTTALRFIRQRENLQHAQAMQKRLRDKVSIPIHHNIPSYFTGGILADVMGLGKTLTIISAITSTLDGSRLYPDSRTANEALPRTKATLVVVSSAQVLNVWESEIEKHVKAGTLTICRFHGKLRPTSLCQLADYDVVLTTYATLSAEHKRRGILHKVEWYRVVLDEAHWIRNQTSRQFKAAAGLIAERRWCLTGTPIQNSLNDLVSLLSFLRFEPFSNSAIFHRYILDPFIRDQRSGASGLRELLRTICLRRDETLLELPQPSFEKVNVALQEEERTLYDGILDQCARDIDEVVSSRAKFAKCNVLFTAMTKLRRLCNHGTFATSSTLCSTTATSRDSGSEQGCDFCSGADEDRLELVIQGDICSECGRELRSTSGGTPTMARTPEPQTEHSKPSPSGDSYALQLPEYGISSKVQAVMSRLNKIEQGSKSLVFSSWVATLDLLKQRLRAQGIGCLRIDGNVNYAARLRILDEFRTTDVPVLLMTVQTGAVGLNLTAADHVHIVEPQWNPSIEEQAIARAVRMGQTRSVTVVRYVVKNSVEENIVHLQKRKRNLAKFTLDGASQDGASGALDDLRFVLDLDWIR